VSLVTHGSVVYNADKQSERVVSWHNLPWTATALDGHVSDYEQVGYYTFSEILEACELESLSLQFEGYE
jgi:hypothetical protein